MMCDFEVYAVLSVRHILNVALHKGHAKALQKFYFFGTRVPILQYLFVLSTNTF